MTDASRRVYLGLGRAFVAIGGIVALGSVLDGVLGWGFFRGSPLGTAVFLVLIGALLLWTVRQADAGAGSVDASTDTNPDDVAAEVTAGSPAGEPPEPDRERP
ncbi:MAG: hypothetical protein R6T93_01980 [Trueperaceae bacterium]